MVEYDGDKEIKTSSVCPSPRCQHRGKLYVPLLKSYISYFGKFRRRMNSRNFEPRLQIPTGYFFFANFHVTAILAIST